MGLKTRHYDYLAATSRNCTGLEDPPLHFRHYKSITSAFLHPGDGLGAGELVGGGIFAEVFADGVLPDVGGDLFDGVVVAEDTVVVAHFPEGGVVGLAEGEGGALFEEADEFTKAGTIASAFGEKMQMVRHEAKGVKTEGVFCGRLQE